MEGFVFLIFVFAAALLLLKTIGLIAHGLLFLLLLPFKIIGALFAAVFSIFAALASVGIALLAVLLCVFLAPLLIILVPIPAILFAGLSLAAGILPFVVVGLAIYGLIKLLQPTRTAV